MRGDLPKVFANKIEKNLNNSQDIYYEDNFRNNLNTKDARTVNKKIADIFDSANFVYKSNVKITTKDKVISKTIVGRRGNYLLTMNNEVINIDEIVDIVQL